jgi:hypothetical protein
MYRPTTLGLVGVGAFDDDFAPPLVDAAACESSNSSGVSSIGATFYVDDDYISKVSRGDRERAYYRM